MARPKAMDSRSKILAEIRQAQAAQKPPLGVAGISAEAAGAWKSRPDATGSENTVLRFVEMLEKVGGEGRILADEEAALSVLRGILGEFRGQALLVPPDHEFERLAVIRLAEETGCGVLWAEGATLAEAEKAAIGVTTAFGGIADTGTVLLWHDPAGRLVALLPATHIVLLKRSGIFSDKLSFLESARKSGLDLGSAPMTWVTGPSLTADIEKVLVRGAHGPRRVIVLIY